MQYISRTNEDLEPGHSTYVLNKSGRDIRFFAYKGETALNANSEGMKINAGCGAYFLRKGFSDAIRNADQNIMEPIYEDLSGNKVTPSSTNEAIDLIYKNELTFSGFKFTEKASDAQKEQAFGKMIKSFVSSSKNADFSSDKNLFIVQNEGHEVAYNNGGSQMQIDGVDIQEKLRMNTPEVAIRKMCRDKTQFRL